MMPLRLGVRATQRALCRSEIFWQRCGSSGVTAARNASPQRVCWPYHRTSTELQPLEDEQSSTDQHFTCRAIDPESTSSHASNPMYRGNRAFSPCLYYGVYYSDISRH